MSSVSDAKEITVALPSVSSSGSLRDESPMYLDNCTLKNKDENNEIKKGYSGQLQFYRTEKLDNKLKIGLRIKIIKRTRAQGGCQWHHVPKKDVASCEKPRGAASRL